MSIRRPQFELIASPLMGVIEVEALKKHYPGFRGGTLALDRVDFEVLEGGVFGFLGPNGAGKTTTIRCLLDLIRPSAGECRVLGTRSRGGISKVAARIGSIVETPAFYPRFTAAQNLGYLARIDRVEQSAIRNALSRVGLEGREKDLVRDYSLGMKQRLGLAAALIKDPQLLILDEPAHGLDPAGIKDIRGLLRELGDEGRTVFLSSHLLTEVQAICDRVAILSKGRCIAQGRVSEVLERGRSSGVLVKVESSGEALRVLAQAGFQVSEEDGSLIVNIAPAHSEEITKTLASKGLFVSELRPREVSLEDVFLELTREDSEAPEESA